MGTFTRENCIQSRTPRSCSKHPCWALFLVAKSLVMFYRLFIAFGEQAKSQWQIWSQLSIMDHNKDRNSLPI